jgi:SAM-dependent methyltransferase
MADRENAEDLVAGQQADQCAAVVAQYAKRLDDNYRYSPLNAAELLWIQERQRAVANLLARIGWMDVTKLRLLEVGCGSGGNLLEFLRFGFRPENLQGIELLPVCAERAQSVVPPSLHIACGDAAGAAGASISPESQDIVFQSTVFSSLLDDGFQQRLADSMWRWVRPRGGVLWYDFTFNNPRNPDVRGVSMKRVHELFPEGRLRTKRITLAPPVARAVTRVHPKFYTVFNQVVWLRTHVLAWVEKPG